MNDNDKTKEQLIEELTRLRRQVADQRRINDRLPILVVTAGFDGYYKEVNAAFESILGWREEELLSRPIIEFIHPADRAAVVEHLRRLKAGETSAMFVDRMFCRDGSCRWISWVVVVLVDRETAYGIGKDISDQMQTVQSFREIEELHRHLADSTPDAVYLLDNTGRVLYANRISGRYFDTDQELLVGKTQQELFPPEKARIHLEHIQEVLDSGQMREMEGLYWLGRRNIWLNVRTVPLRNREGRITSLMGICRDITEQKQAEEDNRLTKV